MTFEIVQEEPEDILFSAEFHAKHSNPFAIAISRSAIHLPTKKRFALRDPWYLRVVPIREVRQVSLRRARPMPMYFFSVVLILIGSFTTYWTFFQVTPQPGRTLSGYPLALLVGGLILPFVVRGRRRLRIILTDGDFTWNAPLVVDKKSRDEVRLIQEGVVRTLSKLGVMTDLHDPSEAV